MLPITALYASLLAALVMVLAALVVAIRKGAKIGLGDAGNQALQVRIRAHANALENIPLALILLALAELNGLSPILLHLAGLSLLVARIAHAYGFMATQGQYSRGRFFGTLATWLVILGLALANFLLAMSHA